jgi:hypothetical protein
MTGQVYIVNLPLLRARSDVCRTNDAATSTADGMLWLQVDGGKPLVVSRASFLSFKNIVLISIPSACGHAAVAQNPDR